MFSKGFYLRDFVVKSYNVYKSNDKILALPKFKEFADNNLNVAQVTSLPLKGRKNCVKRRKCCLPAIYPFPAMISKAFLSKSLKLRTMWYIIKHTYMKAKFHI